MNATVAVLTGGTSTLRPIPIHSFRVVSEERWRVTLSAGAAIDLHAVTVNGPRVETVVEFAESSHSRSRSES